MRRNYYEKRERKTEREEVNEKPNKKQGKRKEEKRKLKIKEKETSISDVSPPLWTQGHHLIPDGDKAISTMSSPR